MTRRSIEARKLWTDYKPRHRIKGVSSLKADIHWLYVLKAGPYYKIGRSKDVPSRVAALRTSCPIPITVHRCIEKEGKHELELLSLVRSVAPECVAQGEWFKSRIEV